MIKLKISADTQREIDKVIGYLGESFELRKEKRSQNCENERYKCYVYVIPKYGKAP